MNITLTELWTFVKRETDEGRKVKIRVNSGSMRPFLRPGDEVVLTPLSRPLKRGDVALARISRDAAVLHAVTNVEGDVVSLRGTANYHARETCRTGDVAAVMANPPALLRLWPSSTLLRRILLNL